MNEKTSHAPTRNRSSQLLSASENRTTPSRGEIGIKMPPSTPPRPIHDMRVEALSQAGGITGSGGAGRAERCARRPSVEQQHQGRHHQGSPAE